MASEKSRVAYLRYGKKTPYARRRRHYRLMREIAHEAGLKAPDAGQRATLARAAHLSLMLEDP
jgi:hypothetical protein